ncbi:Histidine phosphatase superfamily, clade-2-containing protein [Aphelenchoides bicaudatus]|nr:Histidine phosphatase superfamily, clade-2-containing protein [Aphelenchoides bicaudatus]
MKSLILWIFFYFVYVDAAEELIFSHVIFRHGERSPSDSFPNAPFGEETWPLGMGRIFIRSSDHSRAIQSATSFASGVYGTYPKDQSAVGLPDLPRGFVPIPVYSFNAEVDKANRPLPNCRRLKRLQDEMIPQSLQGEHMTAQHSEFMERLSNFTGFEVGIHNCFQVADYIEAARRLNLTLPAWLDESTYEESKNIELKFLRLLTGIDTSDLELKRELQIGMGGNLLNELVDRMELKIACLNEQKKSKKCSAIQKLKTYVYSSHDITLLGLFGALDMEFLDGDQDRLPEFSSLLLIELLKRVDTADFVVKWKYRRPSVLNGTLVELDVPYNTIETLRQRATMLKAFPDPKTWCDDTTDK